VIAVRVTSYERQVATELVATARIDAAWRPADLCTTSSRDKVAACDYAVVVQFVMYFRSEFLVIWKTIHFLETLGPTESAKRMFTFFPSTLWPPSWIFKMATIFFWNPAISQLLIILDTWFWCLHIHFRGQRTQWDNLECDPIHTRYNNCGINQTSLLENVFSTTVWNKALRCYYDQEHRYSLLCTAGVKTGRIHCASGRVSSKCSTIVPLSMAPISYAEHLTVESYTVIICQSVILTIIWYSITHSLSSFQA